MEPYHEIKNPAQGLRLSPEPSRAYKCTEGESQPGRADTALL